MIEVDRIFVESGRLNEHGLDIPNLPHFTYDIVYTIDSFQDHLT